METSSTTVRLPSPVTSTLVAHAMKEVVKFLFFVRQQTPSSYDELRTWLLDAVGPEAIGARSTDAHDDAVVESPGEKRKRRVTSSERAAVKFLKDFDAMLAALTPRALEAFDVTEVAVFLGSTPLRPREIHAFKLESVRGRYDAPTTRTDGWDKALSNAGRKAVRECLPTLAGLPACDAVTRAFLMIRGKAMDEPPEGFLPKRGFKPLTRSTKVRAEFDFRRKDDDRAGDEEDGDDDDQAVWYQRAVVVKGLRT